MCGNWKYLLGLTVALACGAGCERGVSSQARAAAVGKDLCQGLVIDTRPHPMTPLQKPAPGSEVTDPEFGTKIRRITNAGRGGVIKPAYSTTQAWNADESYLVLYHTGDAGPRHELYEGRAPYRFLKVLEIDPPDIEQFYWDTSDSDTLWFIDSDNNLVRFHASSNKGEVVRAIQGCPGRGRLFADSHAFTSWDSKVIGLGCPETTEAWIYRLDTGQIIGRRQGTEDDDPPIVSASGTMAMFNLRVYDASFREMRSLGLREIEHSAMGRLANGHDTYNRVSFDDEPRGTIVTYDLTDGRSWVVVGPANGYPYPPTGTHISSLAYKHSPGGWVAASTGGDPRAQAVLTRELILADTNPGGQVCRVAHHRSLGKLGDMDYWGEPHVVISPSGTRLLFGSDWGGSSVDTYVVELPAHAAQP